MKMDIKQTVIELLTQYTDFKDNDNQLVAWFWKLEMEKMGYPSSNTPTANFLKLMAFGKLTSADTITRVRRLIQEENPELRGKKYEERQAKQSIVKKDLGYWTMSNDKQSSVAWLQAIELERDLTLADWKQAKEMEIMGREMSYSDGYREGYKRALELTQWTISNLIPKENESK